MKHLAELQAYISLHYDLKAAYKQASNDSLLQDSEEEDVTENLASELLRQLRERRTSRASHKDEEECYHITFVRCFFPKFVQKLEWFKHSRGDLHEIDFNIWCPEKSFNLFLLKCASWAKQQHQELEDQSDEQLDFSSNLLQEDITTNRVNTIKFDLGASSAPFHVLGHVLETDIPFRQSNNPWFAHAWVAEDSVMLPMASDDPFSADTPSYRTTSRIHCRMITGMVHVKYERAKQTLGITARYCEVQYSKSGMRRAFTPLNCDLQTVHHVHKTVYNTGMHLAEALLSKTGNDEDSE